MVQNLQVENFQIQNLINGAAQAFANEVYAYLTPMLEPFIVNTQSQQREFIKPKEAADLLDVSIVTLNKRVKEGIIKKYNIPGSRGVYYKRSEILKVLNDSAIK